MSINIPANPAPNGYIQPNPYASELERAKTLFSETNDPSKADEWEDAGEREDVKLFRKTNADNPSDVPVVKGSTIIEGATPAQVLAAIQLPGMRKKWDARIDEAHALERYSARSYLFYSVMKSPSYFVWARDIVGVQQNYNESNGDVIVIQTTVDNDEYVPESGSYSKSRTRATLELSGWSLKAKGDDTEVEYVVKIHLNGSIPTSVVSMVATETPMCVGRVRDVFYTNGFAPYETVPESEDSNNTCSQIQTFDDGDGTEAASGERRWTGYYLGRGADSFSIQYDGKRMYPSGVSVSVEGAGASEVSTSVDESAHLVKVEVKDGSDGKEFQIVITPN